MDVIGLLWPLLAGLWLVALLRVVRDLRRPGATGAHLARCGLPQRRLSPSPLAAFLARQRRHRLPRGMSAG